MERAANSDRPSTDPTGPLGSFAERIAQLTRNKADPQAFLLELWAMLPAPGEPRRLATLLEFIKIDLEIHWQRGEPRRLEQCVERFPGWAPPLPCRRR